MPALSKFCPLCLSVEHHRRLICNNCGYVFAKSAVVSKKIALRPRDTNKQRMARKRAVETEHDTCKRRDTNKQRMARKRAVETEQDTCKR